MISEETDTFHLIDNAQVTVTISGTVGWEAVVRGKPSLLFGRAWYQGCKSVLKIQSYQDCLSAIEKIRKGFKPEQKDVERYAAALQHVGEKGLVHMRFLENIKTCPDPKYEMERIGKALYEAYSKNY